MNSGLISRRKQKLKYYNRAKKIVQNRMIFYFHLSVYLTVILMLMVINLVTERKISWSLWPAWFWGIFVLGHLSYAYIFMDIFSKNPMQSEKFERKASFFVHLIIYVLSNISLIVCNIVYTPDQIWAVYPVLGWGIGLFYHGFFIYIFRGWKIKKWKQFKTIQLMKKYFSIDPFDESSSGTPVRQGNEK